MKIKHIFIIAILSAVGFTTACEREDPEIEVTSTYPVSGEWFVTYKVETSPGVFEDVYDVGYTTLNTYNTAADNGDSIWISDDGHFWDFKVKSGVNMTEKAFSVANAPNEAYESQVTITDGIVIPDQGRSLTGVPVDSIYFKVQFDDDPDALTYIVSGHRRTGFLEDEF